MPTITKILEKIPHIPVKEYSDREHLIKEMLLICGYNANDYHSSYEEIVPVNITKKVISQFYFGSDESSERIVYYLNDIPSILYSCSGDYNGYFSPIGDVKKLKKFVDESFDFTTIDEFMVKKSLDDIHLGDSYVDFDEETETFSLSCRKDWFMYNGKDSFYKITK